MIIVVYILILGAINLFFYSLSKKDEGKITIADKIATEIPLRKVNPFLIIFVPFTRTLLSRSKTREILKGKLQSVKSNMFPEEFFALKIVLAIAFGFAAFTFLGKKPAWVILAAIIGSFVPDLVLNHKIRGHKASIQRVLPETIDLLALCIGAGLDFTGAVR